MLLELKLEAKAIMLKAEQLKRPCGGSMLNVFVTGKPAWISTEQ